MSQTIFQAPLFFPTQDSVSSQEYLLVVSPDETISTDVRQFKNKIWEMIGDYPGHYSKPHITIHNFLGFQQKEELIVDALQVAACSVKSAFIMVDSFNCFEGSGTIYLTPKPKIYFSRLLRSVYPILFECSGINRQSEIHSSTEPHITIARGLKKDQFKQVWPYFKDKTYEGSFKAESLVLLRKDLLRNDNYHLVGEFKLR